MPYSSNSDLPESVRSRYSDNCQSVWRHTFNSVLEDYEDEHRAYASATGQANKCQEKKSMNLTHDRVEPTFKIFAPMLKSSLDGDGKKRVHGIASSTIKDRHGDTMSLSALSDMERSARERMTIFLNHSYNIPEDIAGFVERAEIRQHPQDGEIHDLVLDIVINETNQRAVDAWSAIQNGAQLGLSIGAMIPDGGATRDRKSGTYQIDHVELLETSLVGVPANPRSWVEYAVKSLNADSVVTRSDGEVGVLVDSDENFGSVAGWVTIETVETTLEETVEVDDHPEDPAEDGKELGDDPRDSVGGGAIEDLDTGPAQGSPEDPNVDASEEEDEGAGIGKYINPDIADATVSITTPFADITVDTGNRGSKASTGEASQEAPPSAPETEDLDTSAETSPWAGIVPVQSALTDPDVKMALEILEPSVAASLRNSTDLLKTVTRELIETRKALDERNGEYAALEEMTKEVITKTGRILDKLSNTPTGRRAVVREATEQFGSLEAVYSEEFLKILKRS